MIWYKDGVEIKDDKRRKQTSDGTVHMLTIRKSDPNDAGEYSAKIGEEITKAKLIVEGAIATITCPLTDVSANAKEDVTMSCELSKPNRKVTWYQDGTEIKPNEKFILQTDGTKQKMTIKNVNESDTGEYICRLGEEETNAMVTIGGKLR